LTEAINNSISQASVS